MFDAREWLLGVEEAARIIDADRRWVEAQRELALRMSPSNTGVHSGISDPMRPIDFIIDSEKSRRERIGFALEEVAEAREALHGMQTIGSLEHEAASMLELVHIELLTKKDAASMLLISYDTGKRRYNYGVDWLNAHGLAYAKAGRGLAT